MPKKVEPFKLAEESGRAFSLQAEEYSRIMQKQTGEALEADINPFWDIPSGVLANRKTVRAAGSLLTGSYTPEQYKEQPESEDTVQIVFMTGGQYPDGARWERKPTEEEAAQYESWCK